MSTYTTRVQVGEDRTITVELPDDMPLGDAKVTVSVDDDASDGRPGMTGKELIAWLEADAKAHPRTWTPRTKEEIDAEINAMRDEWDR